MFCAVSEGIALKLCVHRIRLCNVISLQNIVVVREEKGK